MAPTSATFAGDVGAGHVLGRYELLLPIASGGMAMVWAARLKGTRGFQKIVAVKTMLPKLSDDAQFEQMFLDEASLASQVRHPHVVETLDLGEQDGVLYMVMEWIDGVPLHQLIKEARKTGGIPLPVAARIVMQACSGLHTAHELRDPKGQLVGLVHRDISPQNILVTYDGVAKVVDFGVAKATAHGDGATAAGQVKGKAAYMAPEQIKAQTIDRRVDVFAMGVVLYLLTTGKHPFRQDSEAATLFKICEPKPPLAPHKLVPAYPMMLERIVMQALAKDPAKRYPTANDLARALDQSLPRNLRASTDEEVAGFVRSLFGERREQQAAALAAALETADRRAAPPKESLRALLDSQPPPSLQTGSGVASLTEISGVTRPSIDSLAELGSDPSGSRGLAPTPGEGVAVVAPAPPGKSRAPVMIAAAVALGLAATAAFFALKKPEPTAAPAASAPVPPAAAVPPAPEKPSEPVAAAPAPNPPTDPVPAPSAAPTKAPRPRGAGKPWPTATPTAAPKTGWKHDPGF
ncbi:MAG: serine/threonine protein kinase [Myxococcales bacterium]|nr:serine/threonine protein kinase [Myxococcales bacterium]